MTESIFSWDASIAEADALIQRWIDGSRCKHELDAACRRDLALEISVYVRGSQRAKLPPYDGPGILIGGPVLVP